MDLRGGRYPDALPLQADAEKDYTIKTKEILNMKKIVLIADTNLGLIFFLSFMHICLP
jgi:hypothetical protein